MSSSSASNGVLVVGGAGPTGRPLIEGLLERGVRVTMLHSGRHKPKESWYENGIEKLYANAFDEASFTEAVKGRYWDAAFLMYGRLRMIVKILPGHVGRVISVGGVPVYPGYGAPQVLNPVGMLVPQWEESPKGTSDGTLMGTPQNANPKANAVIMTERMLFEIFPKATHFRYPTIYGERGGMSEWSVVKRILDGRRQIVLPDAGLTLSTRCYTQNAAGQLLRAFDRPDLSEGQSYNSGDEQTLTKRQWVEVIAASLGASVEIVSLPAELAVPAWPMMYRPSSTHEVFATGKLRWQLGYRDTVPVVEATERTARYLAANPPKADTFLRAFQDPFDYPAEDALIAAWRHGDIEAARSVVWRQHPGFTTTSYALEKNPADGFTQDERHKGVFDPLANRRLPAAKL